MSEPGFGDSTVSSAARRAVSFLESHQAAGGAWSDFRLSVGASDEWVSGHVGLAMLACGADGPVRRAADWLMRCQHPEGGWGFNPVSGVDSDSTATCILFLRRSGLVEAEALAGALGHLIAAQDAGSGGFRTYAEETILREVRAGNPNFPAFLFPLALFEGWCSVDAYITAMAALALLECGQARDSEEIEGGARFLAASQSPEGAWHGYWSAGLTQPTVISGLASCAIGASDCARKAGGWLLAAQRPDGGWGPEPGQPSTAYDTGLAVRLLRALGGRDDLQAAERGLAWLLDHQQDDGSWQPYPHMRVPLPGVLRPWEGWQEGVTGNTLADDRALYTTASVLSALCSNEETGVSPKPS
jgi:squalene-hopene/tetraprenyl-beta-curcumene cyclase